MTPKTDVLRMEPQSLEAEQVSLGAAMLDPRATAGVVALVQPGDFYREAHQIIARVIVDLYAEGSPVDIITVAQELRRRGQLEHCGGGEYLTALLHETPTAAHAQRYALEVKRCAVLRDTIDVLADAHEQAFANPSDAAELLGNVVHGLEQVRERVPLPYDARSMAETFEHDERWIEERRNRPYECSTARWGIKELDEATGGLEDAGFCIIKGDTNAGKSSLLRHIVLSTCQAIECPGEVVILFGLEESRARWRARSLGWLGHFDTRCLRNHVRWQRELARHADLDDRYTDALLATAALPLEVIDQDVKMGDMELLCRRIAREKRIVLVGIDYLQKVKHSGNHQTEEQEFREVAQRCVRLRDELDCPIVGLSQITQARDGGSYTFGARAFEHEADTRVELHRERDGNTGEWESKCIIHVSKARELDPCRIGAWTEFPTGRWYPLTDENVAAGGPDVAARRTKKGA